MEKNHRALDTGGGRDVKIGRDLGLERFQAQPKWEIPVYTTASPAVFAMWCEVGAYVSIKCKAMNAK